MMPLIINNKNATTTAYTSLVTARKSTIKILITIDNSAKILFPFSSLILVSIIFTNPNSTRDINPTQQIVLLNCVACA